MSYKIVKRAGGRGSRGLTVQAARRREPTHCAAGHKLLPDPGEDTCVIEVGNAEKIEHYGAVIGIHWARQVAQAFLKSGCSRVRITNLDTDTVVDDLDSANAAAR